jgi:hydrogenase maturation protease
MHILIAGIGNIFMGDDAFGCEVAAELAKRQWPDGVRVEDFGIRSFDLAYAIMDGPEVVIFVDAAPRGEAPGTVSLIEADPAKLDDLDSAPDAHSMNPVSVLQMVRRLGGETGRLYVIGCEPEVLESEEIGLSEPVRAAIPGAFEMVEKLVRALFETRDGAVPIDAIDATLKS